MDGDGQKYLFRFDRRRYGKGDKTIEKEQEHYSLIAQRTDIPTPRFHLADLSHSIAPTGYTVMDYMEGGELRISHPSQQSHDIVGGKRSHLLRRGIGSLTDS